MSKENFDIEAINSLIIRAKVQAHGNKGQCQIESDLSYQELEKVKTELQQSNYNVNIVEELGKLHIVIT